MASSGGKHSSTSPSWQIWNSARAFRVTVPLAGSVTLDQEREILAFANRAIAGELERVVPEADGEVVLLERRISKLNQSLSTMEEKMHELAKLKAGDDGIASVYRSVQGLSELDEGVGQKKELLRDIFVANQELKEALRG